MRCTILSIAVVFILSQIAECDEATTEYSVVYSSCSDIDVDGLYYIKPMADRPVIPVICSHGYTMLDASLDEHLTAYPAYLSSFDYPRLDTNHILSRLDDLSTFREWFAVADEFTKFNVAPDCTECVPGDFGDNTVYYIDSHSFCFSGDTSNGCIDDTSSESYHAESCNTCDAGIWPDNDRTQPWLKCTALHMSADHAVDHEHITCVAHGLTFHPSLSMTGDACTCYQPLESDGVIAYNLAVDALPLVSSSPHEITRYGLVVADNIRFDPLWSKDGSGVADLVDDQRDTNVVYLYNADFLQGTYRIMESGTYIIMEDITFNFNAPSMEEMESETFSPNSIDVDELYWYPTHEQAAHDGVYPGLYNYAGAYTLGFFAGITVECDYVTIDLNGHTLQQEYTFYVQQRFFSLIELASQIFVPGQGPANWGAGNDVYASNVVIKNGDLGLTSHHAIHGNRNSEITISGLNAHDFDVAGIACNACNGVTVTDCVIGPQSDTIPLLGRYTHSRAYLPRLKQLSDLKGESTVTFYNRDTTTVQVLVDRLVAQMDMAYFHVVNGVEYDDDADEEWLAAKTLFLRTDDASGWMDGGSSYGVLFGGDGAQVVGIGARPDATSNIYLKNVEIFGIYNAVIEKVKFTADFGATRLIFFDAMDWMAAEDQVDDVSISNYVGDAYSDVTFAVSQVMESWYFQNSLYVSPDMHAHVFEGDHTAFMSIFKQPNVETDKSGSIIGGCGSDIQLHSSKGAIGLRVDGTQNIQIEDVSVHDIYNWATLGSQTWCGAYPGPEVGNEDIEIQYGYTGTRAHGVVMDYASGTLSNVAITNVESYHGEANGLTIYKECDLSLQNVQVDNIHAGTQMSEQQLNDLQLPNLVPRACGVDIRPNTMVAIDADSGIITGENIDGMETCYDQLDEDMILDLGLDVQDNSSKASIMIILCASILVFIAKVVYIRCSHKDIDDNGKNINYEHSHHAQLHECAVDIHDEYTPLL
eukprot:CAMPEP_0202692848 /NCGR_PEP_ID=MMETSP1385-20130828/7126_1 /ASSEMBLY_ACC=CAM_ASM_000861 /TAXON_ID=933848 /ORGANISM="Elphidium margaritaceum" /LENGTH=982 /DNA_ID=CAMNT_0049348447 /DNA_START=45 /DNA_END=2993 /DNA_ORIENTATION=-